jgi:hypothetical protein
MSTRSRAEQVMNAFGYGIQYGEDWDESNVANALREAVEGLNIEPNPERELSIEKHYFIRGQLFVKAALLRLATELDKIAQEAEEQQ